MQTAFHRAIWNCLCEEAIGALARAFVRPRRGRRPRFAIEPQVLASNAEEFVSRCCEKVLENIGYLCGFIRNKEDSTMLPDLRTIDDATLCGLREERFAKFLVAAVA